MVRWWIQSLLDLSTVSHRLNQVYKPTQARTLAILRRWHMACASSSWHQRTKAVSGRSLELRDLGARNVLQAALAVSSDRSGRNTGAGIL